MQALLILFLSFVVYLSTPWVVVHRALVERAHRAAPSRVIRSALGTGAALRPCGGRTGYQWALGKILPLASAFAPGLSVAGTPPERQAPGFAFPTKG
jgi:hypothetical protein